ncbi:MAG TPA: nuclear transport factor 2 family protein [Kiritimatiellia bacterium]|nr:nuclear transport factor 2 family protein [Kiritimatiellia bacterium]
MKTLVILLLLVVVGVGILAALSRKVSPPNQRFLEYRATLARLDGEAGEEVPEAVRREGLERFSGMWSVLTEEGVRERIRSVYADDVWFNDTVHTITEVGALEGYLVATANRVVSCEVVIEQVVHEGRDTFVRWWMTVVTPNGGPEDPMISAGMSHLRFNGEGKVVLHQDFWDAAGGLYEHIPGVGWLLRQIRARL